MEEKQKVQVVFEFDRSEYDAYLFFDESKEDGRGRANMGHHER